LSTANTAGGYSTAIGFNALRLNTSGTNNVAVGSETIGGNNSTNTGNQNTAVGNEALGRNMSGSGSVTLGYYAALNNTTGNNNTVVGMRSMYLYRQSNHNVAIGFYSLGAEVQNAIATDNPNNNNCAIGAQSLNRLLAGSENVAIGYRALYLPGGNTGIDFSGSNNVAIGAGTSLPNGNHQLTIQNVIFGSLMNSSTLSRIRIGQIPEATIMSGTLPSGVTAKLRINGVDAGNSVSTIPSLQLDVVPTGTPNGTYLFRDNVGIISQATLPSMGCSSVNRIPVSNGSVYSCSQITDNGTTVQIGTNAAGNVAFSNTGLYNILYNDGTTGNPTTAGVNGTNYRLFVNGWVHATGYVATSDERLKTDIKKIESPLGRIEKLNGYSYHWKEGISKDHQFDSSLHVGFLAQEVAIVLPEAVVKNSDGFLGINYNAVLPLVTEGVKELESMILNQKNEIDFLKMQIKELQQRFGISQNVVSVNAFTVFPNPITAVSIAKYSFSRSVSSASIVISDLAGRTLKYFLLPQNVKEGQIEIKRSELKSGIYIFSLLFGNEEVISKKIMVNDL
jgi:hypothetical protein